MTNRPWWQWRTLVATAGLGALISGCNGRPTPPAVVDRATLQAFGGPTACTDLESYIEDTAVLQMRTQLEAARDGVPGWGWWGGGVLFANGGPVAADASGASAPAPSAYTTTNNQVAGVDEADFVKNDGTRIFALSGQTLHAVRSWPADQTAVLGTLTIEGYPREMFLDGTGTAVVFSSLYQWYPMSNARGDACATMDCGYYSANTVKVTQVDVSDLSNLKVTRETYVPGYYNSARKVGNAVRLVISNDFNFPQGFKWGPDWSPGLWDDKPRLKAAYDQIIADDEALIRKQTLADWVPTSTVRADGHTTTVPNDCSAFSKVNAPTRLGMVSVVTVNLADQALTRSTILAEPGEIYASTNNLYVATRHWWWWPAPGQKDTTYVHKFDITNPDRAVYVASGKVEGHLIDQFSMDEAASGHFRVVTSITTRVPDAAHPENWWGTTQLTNRLSVLGENAGYLDVVGQTADFDDGESVQSSRIVGDQGFVVTYRQVDPLVTFDLKDPLAPKKVAELTVPGFSTYLQPLDATHLISIGEYTPPPVGGQTDWNKRAIQLAIYDVSDLAAPKQTFTQLVGTANSWSEALYDHKAFNYFAAKKLLAIPFSDWSYGSSGDFWWDSFTSDLRVYTVDVDTGFSLRGSVALSDLYQVQSYSNWVYWWTPAVRRSVMADDFVYAISDAGLRVANVANLSVPLASARFDHWAP